MYVSIAIVTWLLCSFQMSVEATYATTARSFAYAPFRNFMKLAQPFCPPTRNIPYSVSAFFDMNGIRGNVTFSQRNSNSPVYVTAMFDGLDQFGEDERWGWHIHDCPINFAQLDEFPCSTASVGGHFDPDNRLDNVNYTTDCNPNSPELCELGDLSGRFGRLTPDQTNYRFSFSPREFNLYDHNTFVGRSVVIHRTDGFRWACANIGYDGHNRVDTFVARLPLNPKQQQNTIQGDIVLKRSIKRAGVAIFGELFRVDGGPVNTSHNWFLKPGTCNTLTEGVFGPLPENPRSPKKPKFDCRRDNHRECGLGDLMGKCGPLESDSNGRIKFFCTDSQLGATPLNFISNENSDYNRVSLVIAEEEASGGAVLACTQFGPPLLPKVARATLKRDIWVEQSNGRLKDAEEVVDVLLYQSDPHEATFMKVYLNNVNEPTAELEDPPYLQIRERAVPADGNCSNLGPVFEPRPYFGSSFPEIDGVIQTGDRDFIGELRNKVPLFVNTQRTSWLPLFGHGSVVGRSLVLHNGDGDVLSCATIDLWAADDRLRPSLSGYFKKK